MHNFGPVYTTTRVHLYTKTRESVYGQMRKLGSLKGKLPPPPPPPPHYMKPCEFFLAAGQFTHIHGVLNMYITIYIATCCRVSQAYNSLLSAWVFQPQHIQAFIGVPSIQHLALRLGVSATACQLRALSIVTRRHAGELHSPSSSPEYSVVSPP